MSERQSLSAYVECKECGDVKPVMVAPDGYYCGTCVPEDQLDDVLMAIHREF